jgi:hypothetical protein
MTTTTNETTVGVYTTKTTVTVGRKYTTVKVPYIKWKNNSGSLAFHTYRTLNTMTHEAAVERAYINLETGL